MKDINIYIFTVLSLVLVSCNNTEKQSSNEVQDKTGEDKIVISKTQFNTSNFKIEQADSMVFYERFKVTGNIDVPPENRAEVSSFFEGFISKTKLLVGDVVEKGDLLIQLTNPDFILQQQNFLENYTQLNYLKSEFERKKNLLKDLVISERDFQKVKSEYLKMSAKVKGQRQTLKLMNVNINNVLDGKFSEYINIFAPISGKISKVNVSKGMFIQPSKMMMEILDTDHIHLELNVFEKDILKVNIGDTLEFTIPEISTQSFKAHVRLVGAEINDNRSVRVHAHPIDKSHNFSVGMFVEAYFRNNPKTLLSLPSTAFVETENSYNVLRLTEKTQDEFTFEVIEVQDLAEQNNRKVLQTESRIKKDDQFLTKGVFDLVSGG